MNSQDGKAKTGFIYFQARKFADCKHYSSAQTAFLVAQGLGNIIEVLRYTHLNFLLCLLTDTFLPRL